METFLKKDKSENKKTKLSIVIWILGEVFNVKTEAL